MPTINVERKTTDGYAQTIGQAMKTSVPVGTVWEAGTRLQLFPIFAAPYSAAPGTDYRDGPYLRITPVTTDGAETDDGPIRIATFTPTQDSSCSEVPAYSSTSRAPALSIEPDFFAYDVDATQPIYLPWRANIRLVAVTPGYWRYTGWAYTPKDGAIAAWEARKTQLGKMSVDPDYFADLDDQCGKRFGRAAIAQLNAVAAGGARNTLLRHTRNIPLNVNGGLGAGVRRFQTQDTATSFTTGYGTCPMPFGVTEYEFNGQISALSVDPSGDGARPYGAAGAFGTLNAPLNGANNRRTIGNNAFMQVSAASDAQLIFWISLI